MALALPKSKSQWIITFSLVIFISIDIYLSFFVAFDPLTASDAEFFHHWLLRVIRDSSLTIALSGMIIFGIRTIRKDGFSIKRVLSPGIAILIIIILTGLSLFINITMSRIQRDLFYAPESLKENLKECLDRKDLPLSQRSEISLMYARQVWKETGDTIEYITSEGEERVYEPSLEEKEKKKKIARTDELLTWTLKGLKRAYIFWPIVAIICVAIGFFSPIKKANTFFLKQ